MPDFSVTVDRQSIAVSKPSTGLLVTYHKQGRVLVAPELWRIKPSAEELSLRRGAVTRLDCMNLQTFFLAQPVHE